MTSLALAPEERLSPPDEARTTSVARVADDWYVVASSEELGARPLARELLGVPLVLFRTSTGVGALLDRCPHRNVPLSEGRVEGDRVQCGYHGWEFDAVGRCRHIPCLVGDADSPGRRVPAYAARELDGHIWVYATPDAEPVREPFRIPHYHDPAYTVVTAQLDLEGTLHAAAENALDVPHTAFLHGGLFRKPGRDQRIDVVIRRWHDRCEAEYIGETAPPGLIGKILAPGGGVVTHFDRFLLPCITQVEYRLGEGSHLMVHGVMTPVRDHLTRLFGVATFRLPFKVPGKVLGRALRPLGLFILGQDAKMLRRQTETIRRFRGEHLSSTEVDCLGPHILKLLKDAEAGRREPREEPWERRITMKV